MSETYQSYVSASTPPIDNLIPGFGLPCILVSLYTDYPGCWGMMSSIQCCCINWQSAMCKPTKRSNSFMICTSQEMECMHFAPVIKCWCIDTQLSFPPDGNNPLLINLCFCTICHKNKLNGAFFFKVKDIEGHRAALPV